jgi:putative transposase
VTFLRVGFGVSERRACRVIPVHRSTQRYRSQRSDQTALRVRLRDLAAARVRYGYRRLHVLLQREGWRINHKRVYRLYREEGLGIRVNRRRKRVGVRRVSPPVAARPHHQWSMDFLSDRLADGRRFRVLTIVDHVSRVSPAIAVDTSLSGGQVATVLNAAARIYGLPQRICVDNGPEFISKALDAWAYRHGVGLVFSRPGKPTDNAVIEAFNSRFRDECLNLHWFATVEEARQSIEAWRIDYNAVRPHGSLQQRTPSEFAAQWKEVK